MRKAAAAIGFAFALGGSALWAQAGPDQQSASGENQKAYAEAYEKSFRVAFRSKSIENCISSVPTATTAKFDVTPTCTCATDALLATKTVQELTDLSRDSAALEAVTAQCLKSHPPLLATKP